MKNYNLFWEESDGWRFWIRKNNMYYFNDIPDNIVDTIQMAVELNAGGFGDRNSTLKFLDNDIINL